METNTTLLHMPLGQESGEERRLSTLGQLFDLRGRGVVVTGGGSGLGLRMGTVLAEAGATVTLIDREPERLAAAQLTLAEDGLAVSIRALDITDFEELDAAFAQIAAEGGLDVVFANAGISAGIGPRLKSGRITNLDQHRWQEVLDVNLTGAALTMSAAARNIRDGAGRIIVTSSLGGVRADPMVGYAYAATKAGVVALVRNAALELAHRGINVNALAPGLFETNIRKTNPVAEAMTEDFKKASALGRGADVSELDGLIIYLASTASSYMTGAVLNLDGGGQHVGPNQVEI